MGLRELLQKVPKKWQLLGAKILLKDIVMIDSVR